MNFTRTTEYALRILTYMVQKKDQLHSGEEIYNALQIPKKYQQRILTDLVKGGFIKSIRGRNGGFTFSREPETILLSEIITFTEGVEWAPRCIYGYEDCGLDTPCAMHNRWVAMQDSQIQLLSSLKLSELAEQDL